MKREPLLTAVSRSPPKFVKVLWTIMANTREDWAQLQKLAIKEAKKCNRECFIQELANPSFVDVSSLAYWSTFWQSEEHPPAEACEGDDSKDYEISERAQVVLLDGSLRREIEAKFFHMWTSLGLSLTAASRIGIETSRLRRLNEWHATDPPAELICQSDDVRHTLHRLLKICAPPLRTLDICVPCTLAPEMESDWGGLVEIHNALKGSYQRLDGIKRALDYEQMLGFPWDYKPHGTKILAK
eukprot:GEMP01027498.1.p1 GENE.GEMP01027498.1~~GEMP01027498.1.p1  ORF type:complete len:266 (+),score=51.21 GEMP01027498.1:74-799(+)